MTQLRQLDYLARGWSIVPVPKGAKFPVIKWKEFQTRLPTEAEVIQWWTEDPEANTAIITGKISNLAVIDLDGPEGIKQAKQFNLAPTLTVKSGGGGLHYYYSFPEEGIQNSQKKLADKVDIRGEGGLAIAPYSLHASGGIYAWVGGYAALQQPLVAFPKNLLDMLNKPRDEQGYTPVQGQEPWVSELLKGNQPGDRHAALIRLAGYFQCKGLPLDVCTALLLDWDGRNQPPKGAEEIRKQVADVYTRYSNQKCSVSGSDNVERAGTAPVLITTPNQALAGFKSELRTGARTIKTGFSVLDRHTRGLLVGNISVIGAWPGVGKTAFTLGLARSLSEQGQKVLYFPTEMAVNELMRVFLSQGLNIPFSRVMSGELTEEEHAKSDAYLSGHLLRFLSICPINNPGVSDIADAVQQVKPNVLMLDYLQHTAGSTGNARHDISDLVMQIKGIAKENECAAVVTSQFKRPYRDNNGDPIPPTMFDFAETGQIEREVSMALLMSPTEERLTDAMEFSVNFNLAKNRFGKVTEFQMKFNQEFVKFTE
jgi:replicative DNA helicase